jgi:hypothetical protein
MEELPAALAVDRISFMLRKPTRGALLVHSAARNSTCTIRTNKLTPTIIITIVSNRPPVPGSVMSP